jgi:hypothetical protein
LNALKSIFKPFEAFLSSVSYEQLPRQIPEQCRVSFVSLLATQHQEHISNPTCLTATALFARRDPKLLKLPPYISLLCIIVGVAWLFMLPLDDYSRRTYISENALLPGQVHTYFGGSDQNVFRAYRHEITELENKTNSEYVALRAIPPLAIGGEHC